VRVFNGAVFFFHKNIESNTWLTRVTLCVNLSGKYIGNDNLMLLETRDYCHLVEGLISALIVQQCHIHRNLV